MKHEELILPLVKRFVEQNPYLFFYNAKFYLLKDGKCFELDNNDFEFGLVRQYLLNEPNLPILSVSWVKEFKNQIKTCRYVTVDPRPNNRSQL